ncbi:MAG: Orn/Lys/Arg family decarboxylase [Ktedonobacteraceae bacterium]
MPHNERLITLKALLVDDEFLMQTAAGRATRALVEELQQRDVEVLTAIAVDDAMSIVVSDPSIQCFVIDWALDNGSTDFNNAQQLIELIRSRNAKVPIFLSTAHEQAANLSADVMRYVDELVWILEDTPDFIAGRIVASMLRYRELIAPPFNKALMKFANVYEYSWHTPGHTGGTAFLKSPIGRAFHEFFGENLLRSDLSTSVGELGSLLDHSGPIGESEKFAARVFGAHRSYTVTNGSSTSNRVVFMASVTHNDAALVDRNCHKSLEQAFTLTGAIPTYLLPARNHLGIIGPIPTQRLTPEAIREAMATNPLAKDVNSKPVHAVITNSTYDGLCYKATRVIELLGQSVDRIHFDEAWYGYAPFNALYRERFGMYGDPAAYPKDAPTIFTVTSTHKLLAALSQASFIHVRDGRKAIEHSRFNESFMMHASTSPQYAIIASNEISAAMMEGVSGQTLTTESITEAVAFRQALCRIKRQHEQSGDWFFSTWNADKVNDPATGKRISFEDAPEELLVTDPNCWVLHPGEEWHGFQNLEDDYCMLDPIKVSVVTPGVNTDGSFAENGIPAALVTAYLDHRGTEVEKTTDFTILFLFSMGVTKGKWGTLVNALLNFKNDYDANSPLVDVLPELVAAHPERYHGLGLRDLANEMFEQMKRSDQLELQAEAFSHLPQPVLTPNQTYQRLVHDEVEQVPLEAMANRVVASGVVPYPPGIPLLMPGENAGPVDGMYLSYLRALQAWDRLFPGFEHENHGVENVDGTYFVYCLKTE